MQIAATGLSPAYSPQTVAPAQESAERGPDHDNDGDEGKAAAAVRPLSPPPPGRGGRVDMTA